MPELAEVRLTADYVNAASHLKVFEKIEKNPVHKGLEFEAPFERFEISAESRGKEFVLYLHNCSSTEEFPIRMTMGMSGHFRFTRTGEEKKHSHLMFKTVDGFTLSFVDVRRFGKWKPGFSWSNNRGPDPTREFDAFVHNIGSNLEHKTFTYPIGEVLMNQHFFNGIGNYLRAEILYRANQNPFQPAKEAILENGKEILSLCKEIPEWAYVKGGGSIKDWKNPFTSDTEPGKRSSFFLCYGKKSMMRVRDGSGRTLWFDPKWQEYINYKEKAHGH